MIDSVTWKIGGEAGFGIISAGTMLARTFSRNGYHALATNEYPSLIRGGHNIITLRIATAKFESMNRDVHVLVALNKQTLELHKDELNENALVIFDPKDAEPKAADFPKAVKLVPVPLRDIVAKANGEPVMRNTVALGATVAILGAPFEYISSVISDQFKKKGEEVIKHNLDIARAGYDFVKQTFGSEQSVFLNKADKKKSS